MENIPEHVFCEMYVDLHLYTQHNKTANENLNMKCKHEFFIFL